MKRSILPFFVILIGGGSAFAIQNTKHSDSKKIVDDGYIHNVLTNSCEKVSECNAGTGEVCTIGNVDPMEPGAVQVFGLDETGTCNIPLYQQRN